MDTFPTMSKTTYVSLATDWTKTRTILWLDEFKEHFHSIFYLSIAWNFIVDFIWLWWECGENGEWFEISEVLIFASENSTAEEPVEFLGHISEASSIETTVVFNYLHFNKTPPKTDKTRRTESQFWKSRKLRYSKVPVGHIYLSSNSLKKW